MNETYKVTVKANGKSVTYLSRSNMNDTLNAIYYDYPEHDYIHIEKIDKKVKKLTKM